MGAQGVAEVDFGGLPGTTDASVVVTGQAAIVAGSLVEAWVYPFATADHSADEHLVEGLKVVAHSVVAGVGFTVTALAVGQVSEALVSPGVARFRAGASPVYGYVAESVGGSLPMLTGRWSVAWVWN